MIDGQQRVTAYKQCGWILSTPNFKRKNIKIACYPLTNSARNTRKLKLLS